ncbi:hypothetical protein KIPB_008030 [Kipferlia bialata]|uniref:Uncharacterized protein n=1 Tax=Kipferlia bialata TaxID=797122 RepID=A0A9K3GJJ2_9EUKA|nr:hypothetical protein KIPB_008030 [Kipferlia bialata]|eukprot:g8030.t1
MGNTYHRVSMLAMPLDTGVWTSLGTFQGPADSVSTLLGDSIMYVGVRRQCGDNMCSLYDPDSDTWTHVPLPVTLGGTGPCGNTATVVSGYKPPYLNPERHVLATVCDTAYLFRFNFGGELAHVFTYSTVSGWVDRSREARERLRGSNLVEEGHFETGVSTLVCGQYIVLVVEGKRYYVVYDTISGTWTRWNALQMGKGTHGQRADGSILFCRGNEYGEAEVAPRLIYPDGWMGWAIE